jgi:hypothetical protein
MMGMNAINASKIFLRMRVIRYLKSYPNTIQATFVEDASERIR